jgi:dUTP pyrophosphatase
MQNDVFVRVKRMSEDVKLPEYKTEEAACMDLHAHIDGDVVIPPMGRVAIPTGIMIGLNKGWEAQIRTRSGMALNFGLIVANSPGTIDSDYRGEVKVILQNGSDIAHTIKNGDRIAQMTVKPVYRVRWLESDALDDTDRGAGGFGSTGV